MSIQPIATLTLNPALDVSYVLRGLVPDQKVHARETRFDPGGNGINVSRALKRLHVPSRACCAVGGEIGHLISRLLFTQVDDPHCVHLEDETRINCSLQEDGGRQYEVSGVGPRISPEALEELTELLIAGCEGGIGVLTGSLPPGVSMEVYGFLTRKLHQHDARAIVDAFDAPLSLAIPSRPFLIKPNRYELEGILGRSLSTLEKVKSAASYLHRQGVAWVCVSLGAEGAVLVGEGGAFHGKAPPVPVASVLGAGDSMVAGLAAAFARGEGPEEALRLGLACGAGTVQQPGTEIFHKAQVEALLPEITIRRFS